MNYVKVSVILAEIINFILLLIVIVGVNNELWVSKLMGNVLGFSQRSYDSTLFENRMHDLGCS